MTSFSGKRRPAALHEVPSSSSRVNHATVLLHVGLGTLGDAHHRRPMPRLGLDGLRHSEYPIPAVALGLLVNPAISVMTQSLELMLNLLRRIQECQMIWPIWSALRPDERRAHTRVPRWWGTPMGPNSSSRQPGPMARDHTIR
jgi:hypothetical protein